MCYASILVVKIVVNNDAKITVHIAFNTDVGLSVSTFITTSWNTRRVSVVQGW